MLRTLSIALLVALAACGDPASSPQGRPVETRVTPARTIPPAVIPLDPARSRPTLREPEVRDPDLRDAIQIDTFVQRNATVDILWVVDNSGSMVDERNRLAGSFEQFIDLLRSSNEQVSYRVGVTSTEVGDGAQNGRLRGPWIENGTADAQGEFARQLSFPDSRIKREQGLEAARLALGTDAAGPAVNPGFMRTEAALAVIFVSDEDDDSNGGPGFFARHLRSLKGPGNESLVSASAIAGPPPDGCVPAGEEEVFGAEAEAAERYRVVVDATRGAFGSICSDFVPALRDVVQAVRTLRRNFGLSLPPDASSLRVKVCPPQSGACDDTFLVPQDPANGWQFRADLRAIVFAGAYVPPPGALVRVEYALAPDEVTP